MSQRYQLRDGIVIRRHELPNGDVIVTLLSEDGKWRGKAKKGKRLGGNLGRLSLFHDVTVQHYTRQDDDLGVITQVQLNGALPYLSEPGIYPYAHVLAELTDKLTVDVHVGEDLHSYLASGLRGLGQHPAPQNVAVVYAWRLLQQAGLAPRVTRCAVCGQNPPGERFDIAAGGLSCEVCQSGLKLPEEVAADLQTIHTRTLRQALETPLHDLESHWQLLNRYTAYHVSELYSLRGLQRHAKLGAEASSEASGEVGAESEREVGRA